MTRRFCEVTVVAILGLLLVSVGCGGGGSKPAPTITGSWSGTATSAFGGSSTITGNLTQGITNPDGSIQFSGTLSLTNSCLSSITITSGKIVGGSFALLGTNTDGSTLGVAATIDSQDTNISGTYTLTAGLICPKDKGTISLTKH